MPRRGESVPFAFVAEAESFRSNVAPPPPPPVGAGQRLRTALGALGVVAGLVGALVLGVPALDAGENGGTAGTQQEAARGR